MNERDASLEPGLTATCPSCQKPMAVYQLADWPHFPFCSERCKLIDLGRWLGEEYRVPDAEGVTEDIEE